MRFCAPSKLFKKARRIGRFRRAIFPLPVPGNAKRGSFCDRSRRDGLCCLLSRPRIVDSEGDFSFRASADRMPSRSFKTISLCGSSGNLSDNRGLLLSQHQTARNDPPLVLFSDFTENGPSVYGINDGLIKRYTERWLRAFARINT